MSFIDEAPVSATISRILASASASLSCRGRKRSMTADLVFFRRRAVLAAILAIDIRRFAALLDHLLKHLGDERVVVLGSAAGPRLDVAVLDRRRTRRSVAVVSLSPPFMAVMVAALMSSRIMGSRSRETFSTNGGFSGLTSG